MALLQKIKTISRRIYQLEGGTGNNQPARASDVNPIIDWVNNRSDVNTAANAVTGSATAATLNTVSGTITTASLTTAAASAATVNYTVTDAYCTANSTVLVQIAGGTSTTGVPYIFKVVPSAGSFVISFVNVHPSAALNGTLIFKFIIL
jgi:hypothetical protein